MAADIFLSYAREDREKAAAFARSLATEGLSVWWDRNIPPGKSFDTVIEEALAGARCVVVLWSANSVVSDWVKAEAQEGLRRQILVPALLTEGVRLPLGFRQLQAADLTRDVARGQPEFDALLAAIHGVLGSAPIESGRPTDAYRPPLLQYREFLHAHRSAILLCSVGWASVAAAYIVGLHGGFLPAGLGPRYGALGALANPFLTGLLGFCLGISLRLTCTRIRWGTIVSIGVAWTLAQWLPYIFRGSGYFWDADWRLLNDGKFFPAWALLSFLEAGTNLVGGLTTSLILRALGCIGGKWSQLVVTFGWTIAGLSLPTIYYATFARTDAPHTPAVALSFGLSGLIGGCITFWQIFVTSVESRTRLASRSARTTQR